MADEPVKDSFIVIFAEDKDYPANVSIESKANNATEGLHSAQPSVHDMVESLVAFTAVQVTYVFDKSSAFQGFAAKMTLEEAEAMAESDEISYIEQDRIMLMVPFPSTT